MWFGSIIYKKNSVENYTHHLAYSSKQKLLFEMIKKSLEYIPRYKSYVELPSNSLEYMLEDDNNYRVHLKGVLENNLESVLDFLEDHSSNFDGFEGTTVSFEVSSNTPYLAVIEYNKAFDDFNEHWIMDTKVIHSESYSSLDILSKSHILDIIYEKPWKLKFNLEKAFRYAKEKYDREGNLALSVKVIYYENDIFETLKYYEVKDECS